MVKKEVETIADQKSTAQQSILPAKKNSQFIEKLKTGLKTSISSNAATVISVTLLYPLEIVKTRSQIQGDVKDSKAPLELYNLRTLNKFFQAEGIKGMYRGYSVSIFCIPIFNTVYFPLYEFAKKEVEARTQFKKGDVKLYAWSAGLAGTTCNILTNPLWMVRVRMQSEIFNNNCMKDFSKKYGFGLFSLFRIMRDIAQKEGFFALYKGVWASLIGIIHPLVYFPMYEIMKLYLLENCEEPGSTKLSSKYVALAAITCKIAASAASYPHEVLRSRIQYDNKNLQNKQNLFTVSQRILKYEGPVAFYSGFYANLARIVPNYAIMFVLYEHFSHLLKG